VVKDRRNERDFLPGAALWQQVDCHVSRGRALGYGVNHAGGE